MKQTTKFLRSRYLIGVVWENAWKAIERRTVDGPIPCSVKITRPSYVWKPSPEQQAPSQMALKFGLGTATAFMRSANADDEWLPLGQVDSVVLDVQSVRKGCGCLESEYCDACLSPDKQEQLRRLIAGSSAQSAVEGKWPV